MDWQAIALSAAISPIFVGLIRTPEEKRDVAGIEAARLKFEACLAILDDHLAGRAHMNGEAFTMADIPVGVGVNRWYKLPIPREPRSNVERWLERLKERPGFRAHVLDVPLS
jgi:glutathione S-transferase